MINSKANELKVPQENFGSVFIRQEVSLKHIKEDRKKIQTCSHHNTFKIECLPPSLNIIFSQRDLQNMDVQRWW